MTAYRQYCLLTGLLLVITVYLVYDGLIDWALLKFPEVEGRVLTIAILIIFLYAYVFHGHAAASLLTENERAIDGIRYGNRVVNPTSDAALIIEKARYVLSQKSGSDQSSSSKLFELRQEEFEDRMTAHIVPIDNLRVFVFFAGLLVTVVGIVQGFASQQIPTNPEESKIYSFTIIKALGLSYLPMSECLGSTLILYVLSTILQAQYTKLASVFSDLLYEAIYIEEAPSSSMVPEVWVDVDELSADSITSPEGIAHA